MISEMNQRMTVGREVPGRRYTFSDNVDACCHAYMMLHDVRTK